MHVNRERMRRNYDKRRSEGTAGAQVAPDH
nr:MAG TPA: hypothetical protein [Caudoviricetes sp.]